MSGGIVTLNADKFSNDDWSSSEARITIDASDVGVETLDDLLTMSWNVNVVTGYIAHVDVLIDTTGDGEADDALVFEHAKVVAPFDDIPSYPTAGTYDTLGSKSPIINGNSIAWLTSEDSGPIGGAGYTAHTLADWKSGQISKKHGKDIPVNVAVIRFEIEVDGWDQTFTGVIAESEISNIVINGISKEISAFGSTPTLESGFRDTFYINNVFDEMIAAGTYNLQTTVDLV